MHTLIEEYKICCFDIMEDVVNLLRRWMTIGTLFCTEALTRNEVVMLLFSAKSVDSLHTLHLTTGALTLNEVGIEQHLENVLCILAQQNKF